MTIEREYELLYKDNYESLYYYALQIVKDEALLKDYPLPQGTLVMFVKRDNNYLVPNGSIFLRKGDEILLISKDNEPEIADEPKN